MVRSSLLAGAEMMTFFTVPCRWALALVASVKWPVDSITIWAPVEDQSSLAGSRSANTFNFLPSTEMKSSPAVMVWCRFPKMESYLSRWASVAGLVRSLTATNSISGLPSAARNTLRPIRPKPLMPTFTAIYFGISLNVGEVLTAWKWMIARNLSVPKSRVGEWDGEFAAVAELVLHPHHALMDARPNETTWQARSERLGINRQNRTGDSSQPADAATTDVSTGSTERRSRKKGICRSGRTHHREARRGLGVGREAGLGARAIDGRR